MGYAPTPAYDANVEDDDEENKMGLGPSKSLYLML